MAGVQERVRVGIPYPETVCNTLEKVGRECFVWVEAEPKRPGTQVEGSDHLLQPEGEWGR